MSYNPPQLDRPVHLHLNRNESIPAMEDWHEQLAAVAVEFVCRYPDHLPLQNLIGESLAVDSRRIVITAGGDESIDRMLRSAIGGERQNVVTHVPTFEMVDVYTRMYGGTMNASDWIESDFPLETFLKKIDSRTAMVVVVTPNNPTGRVVDTESILRIADVAKKNGARLLVDNAYIEFADIDPMAELAAHENINLLRTFSKAWGLAGLRVGYTIAGTIEEATRLRNLSGPFPVSAVSLELARRSLAEYSASMQTNVRRVKQLRGLLQELLESAGAKPIESKGNFVMSQFSTPGETDRVWQELAADGIGVRKFAAPSALANYLRITCPVQPGDYLELAKSLCRIFALDFEPQKDRLGMVLADGELRAPESQAKKNQPSTVNSKGSAGLTNSACQLERATKETSIKLSLNLYGSGLTDIATGIGFLDHMLTALAFHSRLDLTLKCEGDLYVDDHHTAEDCAIALGNAIDQALGPRRGIKRFGFALTPLDEALARTVIDLSARPWPEIHLNLQREKIGEWACENIVHFFQSLAMTLRCSLHVDVLRGQNDHHRAEAAFKSLALALRQALSKTEGDIPSTKGKL